MRSGLRQKGYLLMSAIVLVVGIGFLAATMTYLFVTTSYSSAIRVDSMRAFYAARSGIELVAYRLLSSDLNQRLACTDIDTNYSSLPGTSLFTDPYTAFFTAQGFWGYVNFLAVLSDAINATDDVIKISVSDSISYVSPRGRVFIDREAIDYRGISTDCGSGSYSFCLTDVTRNATQTGAKSHNAGTPVAQNQCVLTVFGGVPELSSPLSNDPKPRRKLIGEVKQLEAGWIVDGGKIVRWNGAKWFEEASIANVSLNDIEMLSNADIWAVGYNNIGYSVFARLDLNSGMWIALPNTFTEALQSVACVDHAHCHTVGNNGLFASLSWMGSIPTWTQKGVGMTTSSMNGVSCSDVTCRAVGNFETLLDLSTKNVFAEWNGTDWVRTPDSSIDSGVPVENFRGISCVGSTCQAVGMNSAFIRWTGSQWISAPLVSFPSGVTMNDVYCVASNNCWAVGNGGLIAHWSGSAWSVFASFGSQHLNAVTCADENDCWAVGNNGTIAHFDGTTWNSDFTVDGSVALNNFQGVCFSADHSQHEVPWHEEFDA